LKNLNIGCGPNTIDGWVNIDIDHPSAEIQHDIRTGLPFEDDTVSHVFTEHMIEHVTRPEALAFLVECNRVLQPGGVIRVSTPNLDVVVDAYLARNLSKWGALWQPDTPCMLINEAFHSWNHQFLYNRSEIKLLLIEAGFKVINFVEYRLSIYPALMGLERRPYNGDIIVEATA
jgi:predicted SAM-dependent methyltransferase